MNTILRALTRNAVCLCALLWLPLAHAELERWEFMGPDNSLYRNVQPENLAGGPAAGKNTLYFATWGNGVESASWNPSGYWGSLVNDSAGLGNLRVHNISDDATHLYASTNGGGVWVATKPSFGGTLSWSQMTTSGLNCLNVRTVRAPYPGLLLAGTQCGGAGSGVYYYNGSSWAQVGSTTLGSANGIVVYTIIPYTIPPCPGGPAAGHCAYATTSAGIYGTQDYTGAGTPGSAVWAPITIQPVSADSEHVVYNASISSLTPSVAGSWYMVAALPGGGVQRAPMTNMTSTIADFLTVGAWSTPVGVAVGGSGFTAGLPSQEILGGMSFNGSDGVVAVQGAGAWGSSGIFGTSPTWSAIPGSETLPAIFNFAQITDPNGNYNAVASTAEGVHIGYPFNNPSGPQWNKLSNSGNGSTKSGAGLAADVIPDPANSVSYVVTASGIFQVTPDGNGMPCGSHHYQVLRGGLKHQRMALDKTTEASQGSDVIYLGIYGGIVRTGNDVGRGGGCWDNSWTTNGPAYPGGTNSLPNLSGLEVGVLLDTNSPGPQQPVYTYTDRRNVDETLVGRGIYRSLDGGNNWTNFNGTSTTALGAVGGADIKQLHVTAAGIATDGTLIAATRGGLFKTSTGAASWSLLCALPSSLYPGGEGVTDLAVDGTNVYAAIVATNGIGTIDTAATGVYSTTTAGTCTKIGGFPSGVLPSSVAVSHMGSTTTLWVGTTDDVSGGSLYKSTDNGTTWRPSNIKLKNHDIQSIGVANVGGMGPVAAVSTSGGIFMRAVQNGPDFNNDGKADILMRASAGASAGNNYALLMNGLQVTQDSGYLPGVPANWQVAGYGDFDGDGRTDILWRNSITGDVAIWLMNGLNMAAGTVVMNVPVAWNIVGVGDFDGDGKSDILWRNASTGDSALWLMNGMSIASQGLIGNVPAPWTIAGVGDFDGDGKTDIFWRNASTGDTAVWLMNGSNMVAAALGVNVPSNWTVAGIGDFDGDGKSDVLWRNTSTGDAAIWFMNGVNLTMGSVVARVSDATWNIVGLGDFNGDYMTDILWRNSTSGENYIWQMQGSAIKSVCGALGCQSGYLPSVPDTNWQVIK